MIVDQKVPNTAIATLRKEHAAEIIALLEDMTCGDWEACLDIARAQYELTASDLWRDVLENLRVLVRQMAQYPHLFPEPAAYDADELPW